MSVYGIIYNIKNRKSSMIYSDNPDVFDIASFCYNTLGLTREIHIEVKELDANGYCHDDGIVEISNSLTFKDFLVTICHELVHCAQYEQNGHADEEEAYRLEEELYNLYMRKGSTSII